MVRLDRRNSLNRRSEFVCTCARVSAREREWREEGGWREGGQKEVERRCSGFYRRTDENKSNESP